MRAITGLKLFWKNPMNKLCSIHRCFCDRTVHFALVFFAFVLLLALKAISSFAAEAGAINLSLESAVLFALNNNPEINIAKEQENQAGFSIDEAKSVFYPQVNATITAGDEYNDPASFSSNNEGSGRNTNPSSEFNLTVNQMIYDGSSSTEEMKRREKLYESTGHQRNLIQEKIIMDTVQAYTDVYRYQKSLADADVFIKSLRDLVDKIALMVEAGAENQAKLKYASARLSAAQSDYENTKAALKDSVADLEFLTGKLPVFRPKLPDVKDLIQIGLPDYYKYADVHNVHLQLNQSDHDALKHQLAGAKGQYLPAINMLLSFDETHDVGGEVGRERTGSAMLQMSYKIFDGYGREASENKIRSQIKEIEYRRERTERDVMRKIKLSYNQLKALENEYMIVMDEVDANKDLQALYADQFTLGEGDIIRMIEGEERLFASQNKLHGLENDLVVNSFKLLQQIGSLDKNAFCQTC